MRDGGECGGSAQARPGCSATSSAGPTSCTHHLQHRNDAWPLGQHSLPLPIATSVAGCCRLQPVLRPSRQAKPGPLSCM